MKFPAKTVSFLLGVGLTLLAGLYLLDSKSISGPAFYSRLVELPPFQFEADFYGMKYKGDTPNYVDAHVLCYGAYEKPILFFMRDVCPRDGVFVDVGANTGQHSLFMSKHAKVVHAFEPYEPVLVRFRQMIRENLIENIVIHPVGLGNEEAKLPFFAPPDNNLGSGSFVENWNQNSATASSELQIVVGDEAFESANIGKVDLIKIDIEGFEKLALEGLKKTLEAHRPIVVMELSVQPGASHSFQDQEDVFKAFPANYAFRTFYSYQSDLTEGKWRLTPFKIQPGKLTQQNIVAYPLEKEEIVNQTQTN